MGLLFSSVAPTTTGWYSNAPATTLAHRCYWFTWSRSELWKELIQSLFTIKLGVFMTMSSWLTLIAIIQLVSRKPIWDLWLDILINILTVVSKILMIFISYEFIVMKFPEYVKEVLISEMCVSFPTTPNEVSLYIPYACLEYFASFRKRKAKTKSSWYHAYLCNQTNYRCHVFIDGNWANELKIIS